MNWEAFGLFFLPIKEHTFVFFDLKNIQIK